MFVVLLSLYPHRKCNMRRQNFKQNIRARYVKIEINVENTVKGGGGGGGGGL